MFTWGLFGGVFFLWAVSLLLGFRRRNTGPGTLYYRLCAPALLLVLVVLFSRISLEWGGGSSEVLGSSFKRALFYLVPLAGLAAAISSPFRELTRRRT